MALCSSCIVRELFICEVLSSEDHGEDDGSSGCHLDRRGGSLIVTFPST